MKAAAAVIAAVCFVATSATTSAAPPSQISQARAYIRTHGRDANRVAASISAVRIDIGLVSSHVTQASLSRLALDAQTAHDDIDAVRAHFIADLSSGPLGYAELSAFSGANDLKSSMSAFVAWAGDPNAATLARLSAQLQQGRSEWNIAVRTIWRLAARAHPPTV